MEPRNPTPSANYTALVAYIVSVVPEIMEDFHICSECSHSRESHYWNGGGFKEYSEKDSSCHSCGCEEYKHSVTKILGRHITLEDVLKAIRSDKITFSQFAHEFQIRHPDRMLVGVWHLGKPLSEQSENTINWLVSIFPIAK